MAAAIATNDAALNSAFAIRVTELAAFEKESKLRTDEKRKEKKRDGHASRSEERVHQGRAKRVARDDNKSEERVHQDRAKRVARDGNKSEERVHLDRAKRVARDGF